MEITLKAEVGGKTLSIQTGKVAKQASGSVVVQYGETIVMVAMVSAHEEKIGASFLPLTVEYQEKIYAAGRIPGNYFRREIGRPSEKETLTARLIDRPIRFDVAGGVIDRNTIAATNSKILSIWRCIDCVYGSYRIRDRLKLQRFARG